MLHPVIYLHYKICFYLNYFLVLTDFFRTLFKKSNCCRADLHSRKNLERAPKEMYFFIVCWYNSPLNTTSVLTAALSQVFFVFKLLLYAKPDQWLFKWNRRLQNFQASLCKCVDYEQSLFFLGPSSNTRETRKWPYAWLKEPAALVFRVSRARALLLLNLKIKRDCSQSLNV